jgi:hypothetical protein
MDSATEISSEKTLLTNIHSSDPGHTDPAGDLCSPFCQCTCCTAPTLTSVQRVPIAVPLQAEKVYVELLPGKVKKSIIPIWQPPQSA